MADKRVEELLRKFFGRGFNAAGSTFQRRRNLMLKIELALSSPIDWLWFCLILIVAGFFWTIGAHVASKLFS